MQRTEADVVKKTLAMLDEEEQEKLEIGELAESRMTRKQLAKLLEPFKDSIRAAKQGKMDPLKHYLRVRAGRILGTCLLYCYRPTLLANRICMTLAEDLHTIFPDYDILQLLLQNVVIPEGFRTEHFNDFIVTDDGFLIGMVQAFDKVRETGRYANPVTEADIDADLVTNHSIEAFAYASIIAGALRPKQTDLVRMNASQESLIKAMKDQQVTRRTEEGPPHGEAGKKRQLLALTAPLKSINELAEFLDEYLPEKDKWTEFLKAMDRDELLRIIIPKHGQTPQKKDQTEKAYKEEQAFLALPAMLQLAGSVIEWPASDNAKKILAYIMCFTYHEVRTEYTPEYTDSAGGWFGGNSRTTALQQTKGLMDHLLSDAPMEDADKFLTEKKIPVISSPTCLALKNKVIDAGRHCEHRSAPPAPSVASL